MSNPKDIASALRTACAQPHGELDVGIVLSHYIDPRRALHEIRVRIETFMGELPDVAGTEQLLTWFQESGFGRERRGAVAAKHSDVFAVLESREGIPISQALLLMGAARHSGMQSFGINYPGHFLIKVGDDLVDPLGLSILKPDDLSETVDLNNPAPVSMIALRMLNNLKTLGLQRGDFSNALDIIDVQLAISMDAESSSSLHFERGELWLELGAIGMARSAFIMCAETCPYPALAERARKRAGQLRVDDQTLH